MLWSWSGHADIIGFVLYVWSTVDAHFVSSNQDYTRGRSEKSSPTCDTYHGGGFSTRVTEGKGGA